MSTRGYFAILVSTLVQLYLLIQLPDGTVTGVIGFLMGLTIAICTVGLARYLLRR